jgi:hypothetical protein
VGIDSAFRVEGGKVVLEVEGSRTALYTLP